MMIRGGSQEHTQPNAFECVMLAMFGILATALGIRNVYKEYHDG